MLTVQPHALHRVALAVSDAAATEAWLARMLGVVSLQRIDGSAPGKELGNLAGTSTAILWTCGHPFVLLQGGVVARFLERRGPGVQSMAWEVDDNWSTEHAVRDRGIEIISPNIAGRFFFLQPRQTSGLLVELCDGWMSRAFDPPEVEPGLLGPVELAWVTGVVADVEATAAWMHDLMAVSPVSGNPAGDPEVERTLDVAVGNTVVRLVTPLSPDSRYWAALAAGPAWHSFTLRVPSLDDALAVLAAEGSPVTYRSGALAATDPAGTAGLRIDWTN